MPILPEELNSCPVPGPDCSKYWAQNRVFPVKPAFGLTAADSVAHETHFPLGVRMGGRWRGCHTITVPITRMRR